MPLDNARNFAKVTVSTGYDASATSIVLTTGHGARLPTAPFNVVYWNATDYGDPADDPNVEIVRVTNIASDTLTVTRAQEGTSASTKNTAGKTYRMIATLTASGANSIVTVPIVTVTGSNVNPAGSAAGTHYFYVLTAAVTITLPTAVGNTSIYFIKARTGTSQIASTSGQTFDGAASPISLPEENALTIVSDGSNWRIF